MVRFSTVYLAVVLILGSACTGASETRRRKPVTLSYILRNIKSPKGSRRRKIRRPRLKKIPLIYPKRSESVGRPFSGYLVKGRRLPDGRGYKYKGRARYGTDETVSILIWAIERTLRSYPNSADLIIKDLSRETGGRLRPHKSHRTGRDVDIGYYMKDNEKVRNFKTTTKNMIDGEKTWYFIEQLLRTGAVHYIFIDRRLQRVLYKYARDSGWREKDLRKLFEYPRYRAPKAIIRNSPGHRTHMHVRFRCPPADKRCED